MEGWGKEWMFPVHASVEKANRDFIVVCRIQAVEAWITFELQYDLIRCGYHMPNFR
jgi:hypothetical protein